MRLGILTGGRGEVVDLPSLIQEVVQAEEDEFDSFGCRKSRPDLASTPLPHWPWLGLILAELLWEPG